MSFASFSLYFLCAYIDIFMRFWLHLAAVAVLCVLAIAVFAAWRADRRERDRLQSELSAAQKAVAQLTAAQAARHAQLNRTLRGLAGQKRSVNSPAAALRALRDVLPLPSAIREGPPLTALASPLPEVPAPSRKPATSLRNSAPSQPKQILLPAEDLKPLYDYAVDCKACQAKLAVCRADLTDEQAKAEALRRERDAALRAARGGSVWVRIGRAAKWSAIGAALGALAASARR